jgi:alkylation response protein AidB-like acyl-CoA dehydrogenase
MHGDDVPLVLSEEQELLRQTARELIEARSPVSEFRRLRDSADPVGFSRELWSEMAQLGWAGIPFPEAYGGADLGCVELGVVLEECGRRLVATPLVSTVLLGGSAVLLGGNETQKKEVLTAIAAGQRILALGLQEGPRHAPHLVETRAERRGGSFRLSGHKDFVLDGHVADQLLIVARTAGGRDERAGLSLFLLDAGARGVTRTRTRLVDGRNAARIELDGVEVDAGALVGEAERGAELLDAVLDRAAAGLAAEMLGGIDVAFLMTLDYLKARQQFGVPIGSFQALKHRAARMFVLLELSRSAVLDALQALDARHPRAPQKASIAKAWLGEAAFLIGNEGVQLHGGLGVTDEQDIGLYMKRARAAQFTFGDSGYHRDRYARLEGF